MSFEVRSFSELTAGELYEILRARADVFTGEEKILYPDADGMDYACVHVYCAEEDGTVTAYLRMFWKTDEPGTIQLGRVLTRCHGKGLGRSLLAAAEKAASQMGAEEIYLESQKQAEGFYRKAGYETVSGEFLEAGIPHVQMRKQIR